MSPLSVTSEAGRISVAGTIDFDNARQALADASPAIAAGPAVTIDLSGVQRSNSAGLALMIEWQALGRRHGHDVSFAGVPDGLRQLARVCQVEPFLAA